MNCENCQKEHDGTYKSGRFCSEKCAKGFSTKEKRTEINERVSKKLEGTGHKNVKKICLSCQKEFEIAWNKRFQVCCSNSCSAKIKGADTDIKKKQRNAQLKLIKSGTFQGWKTRTKDPSYPEKYFISLFEKENIDGWKREYKIGKWFIDFAFIEQKFALEIDGKQHEERKEQDQMKDNFLKANDWCVLRIKWHNPINELNKEKLYNQILQFKNILNERRNSII